MISRTEITLMRRVAVITGASRGIGAATALVLAERGFRVVVNHRASAPQAEEVVAAISAAGGEAVAIQADVTAPGDVAGMVSEIDQRWDGVDVLVHNALMPYAITSFAELTWEQLGGKVDRELRAAFLLTKAGVPGMVSRGYVRLVYLTAGLSRRPRDGMITLGTAKAALDQFVRFIALELAPVDYIASFLNRLTRDEAQRHYERYIGPYFSSDGQVDLNIARQAIDTVAAELGVASVAADEIYQPAQ
jgi:3-oxoacyl-[acyl-carrier protein] reductase